MHIHSMFGGTTIQMRLFIEPRDIWIGLYWKRYPRAIDLYFCVLPCVSLNVYVQWGFRW